MSDRDDFEFHCETCRCHELGKWPVRRDPDVIPEAKALLAWSDEFANSEKAWQFEECARIHPLFWYRDEDYPNEQVSYLQWGYNYEAEHLGEPNFFYATCFDVCDGKQYECATDLEIVGAVCLLMKFPEQRPDHVAPEDWGYGSDVMEELWDTHLHTVGKVAPLLARYMEQVIANHSEEYPALQIVIDEIDSEFANWRESKTGNWLEIVGEVDGLDWDLFVGEEEPDERRFLTLRDVASVIMSMCEFVLDHKLGED